MKPYRFTNLQDRMIPCPPTQAEFEQSGFFCSGNLGLTPGGRDLIVINPEVSDSGLQHLLKRYGPHGMTMEEAQQARAQAAA